MTFHIAGWSAAVDQATPAAIAALADPSITVSANNIQIPDFAPYLVGAFGVGVNLTRMRLESPSLRRVINYDVFPFNVSAALNNPLLMVDNFKNPISLDVAEQMQCITSEDGAGATRMSGFVMLGDGKREDIVDPIYTVRVTAAQACVAYAWTNAALVFDQVLPVGDYAIVGAKFQSTNMLAFRFLLQSQTPRPGGIGQPTFIAPTLPGQSRGGWGVWGVFNSTTPPTVDFLAGAADAAEIGYIDLVKVG